MSLIEAIPNWIVHYENRGSGKLVCEMNGHYLRNNLGQLLLDALNKRSCNGHYAYSSCGCWPVEEPEVDKVIPRHSIAFVSGVLNRICEVLNLPNCFRPPKYFLDFVR